MNSEFQKLILQSTGARSLRITDKIQTLWSGYGEIVRVELEGASAPTVVVKYVKFPNQAHHPRGWNTNLGHQRKVKSYEVEMAWYGAQSKSCGPDSRIPHCFLTESRETEHLMVLEDLDQAGYPLRKSHLTPLELRACLDWLANFHATFLMEKPKGLWPVGTYWHLATRPDEWEAMENGALKDAATAIDTRLNQAKYKSLVHGDAKVANFCFPVTEGKVAAVDFQYVGGGCGMKDVAYFLGSCLDEDQCEEQEEALARYYFSSLKEALSNQEKNLDFDDLQQEWQELYPFAWTDFYRFLQGWSPTHWKINSYTRKLADKVLRKI